MTSILSEKEYQHFIMDRLSLDNGYIVRKATSYQHHASGHAKRHYADQRQ